MIVFDRVTKRYRAGREEKTILDRASFSFDAGHNYGILGGNGAGKSTLLRIIAGAEHPNSGWISRRARVSFPLGFSGTFHGHLSGRQNAAFLARIYGVDERRVADFVWDFAELGAYFDMPIQTYSSGMAAKLAFGVSLAIDFDVYLVDEVTEVGDARFRKKCAAAFMERMAKSDIIMVSHNSHTIKAYCDRGAVLNDGRLEFFDSIDEAMRVHRNILGASDA
ncbi:ABC transporter ATP-binding protein [Rhodoblastus acidophilus]|uniref:ABC transporter ATP-binding protein n=1 Tax=Candidatus Rhodoblastus alkanivorans TaxID=2954117 RepID=A0ABS9Z470_9HYPH|nr:ABC transporter ATP-binding protein [Candidatus Rhodoblastus alkanivorans]MCI4677497.1 ABC transporter ATP-binding protein [Candidatus Rhodoblastus alkanivorans]MCI4681856.1 ABC transporter ATP-binding protein [Candidatus Rhodoblastus alkanivorans]MDI4642906.1 ABC transporter ATP-binding protein [Rhodoblastus acidophilus]